MDAPNTVRNNALKVMLAELVRPGDVGRCRRGDRHCKQGAESTRWKPAHRAARAFDANGFGDRVVVLKKTHGRQLPKRSTS